MTEPTTIYVVVEEIGGIDIEVTVHTSLEAAFNGDDHLFHVRRDGTWAHEDGELLIFEKAVTL